LIVIRLNKDDRFYKGHPKTGKLVLKGKRRGEYKRKKTAYSEPEGGGH